MKKPFIKTICLGAALLCSAAMAQTASPAVRPPAYGPDINADHSRRIAAAAVAEAKKYGWAMAISVVDTAGQLV
ncbi:MAG: heme-binding protein, partial [Pseudomonadota bacterium]